MATGGKDRQACRDRAADMEQREAIDRRIQLIETVNLSEAPCGMNLIAVGQADKFRAAGRAAGMEQGAYRVAIGSERKLKDVTLRRDRLVEADHLAAWIALAADHQNEAQ